MFKFRSILLLFMFFVLNSSCNKDDRTRIPVVEILSPVENEIFKVADTIPVVATINDEREIRQVQVVLVNEDFTPVAKTYIRYPTSNNYNLEMEYPIGDNTLETGAYYILVKAENESKFKNEYRRIKIVSEPLKLEKVMIVTGEGYQHISINEIDSSQTVVHLFDVDCNYAASAVSSGYRQFYLAGKTLISLRTYSMADNSVEWEVPPGIPAPIHNDNCLYVDEYLFATYNSQYIRGYDTDGAVVFTVNITSHDKPGAIIRTDDYVLVDMQKQNSAGTPELVTYFVNSGIKLQIRQTQFEVSGFFRHSENRVYISANSNETGQLFIYNIEFDQLEHLADLPDKIVSSEIIDTDRLLLGTGNDIYIYDYLAMQLVLFLSDFAATNIKFEPLGSYLYLSSSKEIKMFKFPQMILQNTFLFEDTIKNVHLLYNK